MNHPRVGSSSLDTAARTIASAAVILLLTSCTSAPDDGGDVAAPHTGSPTIASTSPSTPTPAPLREARAGWKVFTDPARLLSFELPESWKVQTLQAEPEAYSPGSLHYAVRTSEGSVVAELHTGVLIQEPSCEQWERTPYHVIGSEPLEGSGTAGGPDGPEPRFVTRLITGFLFFGSYGITDQPGGDDGLACALSNTVERGGTLGRVSFGDLVVVAPKAPADTGPATVAFGTIGEAEEYYADPDFGIIGDMIRSLQFTEEPPEPG